MANRQNVLENTDFTAPEMKQPAPANSVSNSNSQASKHKFTWVGSSPFSKIPKMKSRTVALICGIVGMVGWVGVFGLGMLVNSKVYRDQLAASFDVAILAKAIITFTPTNVALLAMFAGFLGGCASLLMYSDYDPNDTKQNGAGSIDQERLAYLRENPISSALRGFVVYLTFLAGTVFSATGAFTNTTQDQYCRLAGAVAVLAFGVGYDPTVFRQVLSLVTRRADSGARSNQHKPEPDPLPAPVATR